jgi:hypothetical protein
MIHIDTDVISGNCKLCNTPVTVLLTECTETLTGALVTKCTSCGNYVVVGSKHNINMPANTQRIRYENSK